MPPKLSERGDVETDRDISRQDYRSDIHQHAGGGNASFAYASPQQSVEKPTTRGDAVCTPLEESMVDVANINVMRDSDGGGITGYAA